MDAQFHTISGETLNDSYDQHRIHTIKPSWSKWYAI